MVLTAVYPWLTSSYAIQIYIDGKNRLTARDGFKGIATQYYIPVEQYAATNFTLAQIDNALSQGYINQQEYDETIAYIQTV